MNYKKILILITTLLILIFIFQNTESTPVVFLTFEFIMPRAVLLAAVFAAGIIVGVLLPFNLKKEKNEK
ncbi:MAG: DUF1049 domain-containing protein [Melioribacteraceae bacterium]|nr:DUF1049 domain-containing protein [Melioribacteraceae bacterium]